MKTLFRLFNTVGVRKFIIILFLCSCSSLYVNAQSPFANESLLAVKGNDVPALKSIKDFSAQIINNTVFLNLIMKGENENSIFLLEKSIDGIDFSAIAQKNGCAAPSGASEVLYSFSDPNPTSGKTYYRIRQFRKDGILYSHMAAVYYDNSIPLVEDSNN